MKNDFIGAWYFSCGLIFSLAGNSTGAGVCALAGLIFVWRSRYGEGS